MDPVGKIIHSCFMFLTIYIQDVWSKNYKFSLSTDKNLLFKKCFFILFENFFASIWQTYRYVPKPSWNDSFFTKFTPTVILFWRQSMANFVKFRSTSHCLQSFVSQQTMSVLPTQTSSCKFQTTCNSNLRCLFTENLYFLQCNEMYLCSLVQNLLYCAGA